MLSGAGTPVLAVRGRVVTIDATQLSALNFAVTDSLGNGLAGVLDTRIRQRLALLPGSYGVHVAGATADPLF